MEDTLWVGASATAPSTGVNWDWFDNLASDNHYVAQNLVSYLCLRNPEGMTLYDIS